MIKIFVVITGLILSLTAFANGCLVMGITFTTQDQIDNFQVTYPDCTEIIGEVRITGSNITNLNGLNTLTSIWSDLVIDYANGLTNLTGLVNLTSVRGLVIMGNPNLINLNGLEALVTINERLWIYGNSSLISLTGINNVSFIGGDVMIYFNDALIDLSALENVTYVQGLLISGNDSLATLEGLNNITSCNFLEIADNSALNNLTDLENLTSVNNSIIYICNNEILNSLTGLDNIDSGSITELTICNNSSLSTCDVQSVCDYLANPNGTVEIYNNSAGCNSIEEVNVACGVGLGESALGSQQSAVNIYPNPTSNQITISTPTTPIMNTSMTIFNINGQVILSRQITKQQTVVDLAGLSQGIYLVRVVSDDGVQVGKFVKQ